MFHNTHTTVDQPNNHLPSLVTEGSSGVAWKRKATMLHGRGRWSSRTSVVGTVSHWGCRAFEGTREVLGLRHLGKKSVETH